MNVEGGFYSSLCHAASSDCEVRVRDLGFRDLGFRDLGFRV